MGGAALEGGIIGGAFGANPALGILALGTLGVASENDLWKFGLAAMAEPTSKGPTSCPIKNGGSPKPKVDPQLKAEVADALSAAKAEASHTTLYHGGNLRDGAVQPGPFSTTPSAEHAAQYGPLNQFDIPTEVLNAAVESGDVQILTDSRAGTGGHATEYRFRGNFSARLNEYLVQ